MASTINAITTGAGGIVTTGDSSGNISLQSNGTTVLATTATGANVTGTFTVNGSPISVSGGATTTSSAVDITLTSSSNRVQDVTMTAAAKSVILPNATTITTLGGPIFIINNRGGNEFYIKNNGGVIIAVVKPFASIQLSLNANATANGTWAKQEGDIFFGQYVPSQVTTDLLSSIGQVSVSSSNTSSSWSNNTNSIVSVKKISSTSALILWSNPVDSTQVGLSNLKAVVATVSSGSISYGTAVTVYTGTTTGLFNFGAVVLSSTAALVYIDKAQSQASVIYPLVLSGSTITVGTVSAGLGATAGQHNFTNMCFLSSTTAMVTYAVTGNTTGALAARTVTHNGSSAPTLSTASTSVNADATRVNVLIPLTSTTCQWCYNTQSNGAFTTRIITSTGGSTAPTLGTALTTTITSYPISPDGGIYQAIGYAYSSTETAMMISGDTQMSFTISGTTITQQAFTTLRNSYRGWQNNQGFDPAGTIAWFNSTQGVYIRTISDSINISTTYIPVSYITGTGIAIGDVNETIPTINGYGLGSIDALDSTTAIAAIPYPSGIQAQIVTLL